MEHSRSAGRGTGSSGKEVLLISTDHRFRNFATRYLAGFLAQNGIHADILFIPSGSGAFADDQGNSETLKKAACWVAQRGHYELVGISLMTGGYLACKQFLAELARCGGSGRVVVGGIHALRRPDECRALPGMRTVVMGPGEYALLDLVNGIRNEEIPEAHGDATMWRRVPIENLPFPLYDFTRTFRASPHGVLPLSEDVYARAQPWGGMCYYLTTGFGCPYRCSYCSNPEGKTSRMSVERAMAELKNVKGSWPLIQAVDVQDESFFYHDDDWIDGFCRRYAREIAMPLVIRMMPRFVTASRIQKLADAGLRVVKMGLQGSERLNRELYGRPETSATFISAMETLSRCGVGAEVDVILDNPWENQADLDDMLGTLNSCPKPFWVHAYGLTLYPGTALEEKACAEGVDSEFSTDPYASELWARAGRGYVTPRPWRQLIQSVVGWAEPALVGELSHLRSTCDFATKVDALNSLCPYRRKEELLSAFLPLPVPRAQTVETDVP